MPLCDKCQWQGYIDRQYRNLKSIWHSASGPGNFGKSGLGFQPGPAFCIRDVGWRPKLQHARLQPRPGRGRPPGRRGTGLGTQWQKPAYPEPPMLVTGASLGVCMPRASGALHGQRALPIWRISEGPGGGTRRGHFQGGQLRAGRELAALWRGAQGKNGAEVGEGSAAASSAQAQAGGHLQLMGACQ